MQEQFHLTAWRDASYDGGNRHHATQDGLEIRHGIVFSRPIALPHLLDDLAIGQGIRQSVQYSTGYRIRNPLCVEGPYLVRYCFEHKYRLAVTAFRRTTAVRACCSR